jgi:hypothetical protein
MAERNARQILRLHCLPFEVLTIIAQNIRRGDDSNYETLIAFASAHTTLQQFGECELYYHIRIHDRNILAKLLGSFNIKRLRNHAWNTKVIALGHGLKRGFDSKDLERLAQYCTNVEEFTIVGVRLQRVRGAGPGVDLFGVGESIHFHKLKCRLMRNDSDRQQRVSKN